MHKMYNDAGIITSIGMDISMFVLWRNCGCCRWCALVATASPVLGGPIGHQQLHRVLHRHTESRVYAKHPLRSSKKRHCQLTARKGTAARYQTQQAKRTHCLVGINSALEVRKAQISQYVPRFHKKNCGWRVSYTVEPYFAFWQFDYWKATLTLETLYSNFRYLNNWH